MCVLRLSSWGDVEEEQPGELFWYRRVYRNFKVGFRVARTLN